MTSITCFFFFLLISLHQLFGVSQLEESALSPIQSLSGPAIGNTEVPVLSFKIKNNSPQGFYLKIKSLNQGRFIRYTPSGYATSSVPGNIVPYTLSLVSEEPSGMSSPNHLNNLSLTTDIQLFFYKKNSKLSLKNDQYTLKISSNPTPLAFKGTFKDTLSVEIVDL